MHACICYCRFWLVEKSWGIYIVYLGVNEIFCNQTVFFSFFFLIVMCAKLVTCMIQWGTLEQLSYQNYFPDSCPKSREIGLGSQYVYYQCLFLPLLSYSNVVTAKLVLRGSHIFFLLNKFLLCGFAFPHFCGYYSGMYVLAEKTYQLQLLIPLSILLRATGFQGEKRKETNCIFGEGQYQVLQVWLS